MFTELPLGEDSYQIGRLAAMSQFHVTRKIAPVLASMGVSVVSALRSGSELGEENLSSIMGTASELVARMSNEDVEYVIFTCLSVVRKRQGDRWAAVVNGKNFQFQDMDMQLMLRLTIAVLKENMGSFFQQPTADTSTNNG
jgi:maleate cis-trans isomerase